MRNAFYLFLWNLFCFVCYLVILNAKTLIFRCFTYLWPHHLLVLSFPFYLFHNILFIFLSVAWKARHGFFLRVMTNFASFTRTWFSAFVVGTFLFWFSAITIILVALTLAVILGLIYFLNFFHGFKSQITLIIMIKCIETYTMIFRPINSFLLLINFWCVIIGLIITTHFQKLLYLVIVLNLLVVDRLARLMKCSTDICLILLILRHTILQRIRWPHRIGIWLKSDLIKFIRHTWSCPPMISFSADCRFCE